MTADLTQLDIVWLAAISAVMALGGFVKGAVGFAMPMISLAGLGLFLTAQEAIALVAIPAAISNIWQTLREGIAPAIATIRRYWVMNLVIAVLLALTAQLVPHIASDTLYVILGTTVGLAAVTQLLGWRPRISQDIRGRGWIEAGIGLVSGTIGGITGVWGPIVLYWLIALGTEKREQVRMLGVTFLIGWAVLTGAHLGSGILNATTLPLSVAMLIPVVAAMWLGMKVQDRVDQRLFQTLTLIVLCVAGLNLLRRGLM